MLKESQRWKKKKIRCNRYSLHLTQISLPRIRIALLRWCTRIRTPYVFIRYFCERAPLLGPTSQYRMHFRLRLSRFAIPFVRGLFHARLSRLTLLLSLFFAPRSLTTGMFYLAWMTYTYPEYIPVCKSRERRVFATNCSLSMRNFEKWNFPSNEKSRKRYVFNTYQN